MKRYSVLFLTGAVFMMVNAIHAGDNINALSKEEKKQGWKLLFDGKSLDGWRVYRKKDTKGWVVKDGAIHLTKGGSGDLMTMEKYGDFEFSIDWKFVKGNNSGIIYRVKEMNGPPWATGPEMQVMSQNPKDKLGDTSGGSLYDMYAPKVNAFKGKDQWTTYKVKCQGNHIQHYVNGELVVDTEIGSKDWQEHLAKSKWKSRKTFATVPVGHITLQDHGAQIMFRNVKIRVLDKE